MTISKIFGSVRLGEGKKDNSNVIREILSTTPKLIRVVDIGGQNPEDMNTSDALQIAFDRHLDLVIINPEVTPPICKMIDLKKRSYALRKNALEARKKQKSVDVKEVKLRPVIDEHDYQIKVKAIIGFLKQGCKVKISLKFRGREIAHQDIGYDLFNRIKEQVVDFSKVDYEPKLEGKQMTMILSSK
ncbi:translation initiation factor IF-3 [Candidatus Liberibacter americanus]|uniref:Translation initiation factor IF-3 n=1 Tax=Candidatus Liberibacter americanus str. Sao Paulo TaxID=1261131 RepID=U6B7M9_9HYPH|nr:translation initiation factor IF-3 [Candidatus Liberibacter americanus]AHA27727.1 Translation initiation factor IF3 [Candidatus Liberibacter americanus str. Sao Paulo]EMS36433.1 translation initiation factor IF-3 [Candidatus Liberibacter americanus PW_SP]